MPRTRIVATLGIAAALAGAGLGVRALIADAPDDARRSAAPAARASGPGPEGASVGASTLATPTPSSLPALHHPVSLPALMRVTYRGSGFRIGRVVSRTGAYTQRQVTFQSQGLTVSGLMNVPTGRGPFPVLVLAHGYVDPAIYTTGRGFRREQDALARAGYVVVHVDYRNHASSDRDPENDVRLRLGYTEDVVNAALAIRSAGLSFVDGERLGLLGRSMGGGVALNVAVVRPDVFDAIAVYAPVSSDTVDNHNKWTRTPGRRDLAQRIESEYGSPEANPAFWRDVSPVSFFDRISVPILVHHGIADETCPIEWTQRTVAALRAAGRDVTLFTYPGEGHEFGGAWPRAMTRTVAFFDRLLRHGS